MSHLSRWEQAAGWLNTDHLNLRGNLIKRTKRTQYLKIQNTLKADIFFTTEHHIEICPSIDRNDRFKTITDCRNMKMKGYNSFSKHRDKGQKGGTAIHYKAGMPVEHWEGAELPQNRREAGRNRQWIKVRVKDKFIAMGVVYMPNETKGRAPNENYMKYTRILEVLHEDITQLNKDGIAWYLNGDFNAWLGDPAKNIIGAEYGIEGNDPRTGRNGDLLSHWMSHRNIKLINANQTVTKGTWTRQDHRGRSVLDLVLTHRNNAQDVSALIIDEDRELTNISTDHNISVSILKVNYNTVEWQPSPAMRWDLKGIDDAQFNKTLQETLQTNEQDSIEQEDQALTQAIQVCLQKHAKLVPISTKTPKALPQEILEMNKELCILEKEKADIFKQLREGRQDQEPLNQRLAKLIREIKSIWGRKTICLMQHNKEANIKTRKLIGDRAQSKSKFWNIVKDMDKQHITSLKEEDDSLTTSQQATVNRVQSYYTKLFSTAEPPKTKLDIQHQKAKPLQNSASITAQPISPQEVKEVIKKLKKRKAPGPDNIPNEVFKIGAKTLIQPLTGLFNNVIKHGVTPPAWGEGIMHLIFKGKGDVTNLSDYRAITVNNTASKIFTSIINKRLYKKVETAGTLGQIQNGTRKNRRTQDSLFILRTIIDKAGKTGNKNLTLLFIDLAKAYDTIPHDLLWAKLEELNLPDKLLQILKSLYANITVKVLVNGHPTDMISMKRGIKQGCVLSPLLFALYISGLAKMLEDSKLGVSIMDIIISGLFYVDDLILIGKNRKAVETLLTNTQYYLETMGMRINCDKSNILTASELDKENFPLYTSTGEYLGEMKNKVKYKYLGVQINPEPAAATFESARREKIAKLKSYFGLVLKMANNSHDRVNVGAILWKSCALPSVLHGIEIITLSKHCIHEMESIQARFGAALMGVRSSTAHCAIRKELGLPTIESLIYKRKLIYAARVANLPMNTWIRKAYGHSLCICLKMIINWTFQSLNSRT